MYINCYQLNCTFHPKESPLVPSTLECGLIWIVSLLIKLVKIHFYWSRIDCLIQYHDFGLLTSKTMRQYIFVVLSHPVCDIWLKNPWKKRIRDFGIRKWNATVINTWKYRRSFGIGLWIKAGRNFRCMIEPRLPWRDLVEI